MELDKKLTEKTIENMGRWALANLDVDEIPELASSLQVVSVPSLFLIHRGNAMTSYHGPPSEKNLATLWQDLALLSGLTTDSEVIRGLIDSWKGFIEEKKWEEALLGLNDALRYPGVHHGESYYLLSKAYVGKGDLEAAKKIAETVKVKHKNWVEAIEELLATQEQIPSGLTFEEALSIAQSNLDSSPESRAKIAAIHFQYNQIEAAIEQTFSIIEQEGKLRGFGHNLLLEIISKLGNGDSRVKEGKKRLNKLFVKFNV